MRPSIPLLLAVLGLSAAASASNMDFCFHCGPQCQIDWYWVQQAELIVVAELVPCDDSDGASLEVGPPTPRSYWLNVQETLKGEAPQGLHMEAKVHGLTGHEPFLLLLRRTHQGAWEAVSRGGHRVLSPCFTTPRQLRAARDLVLRGLHLGAAQGDPEAARIEWLVEAACSSLTREQGMWGLLGLSARWGWQIPVGKVGEPGRWTLTRQHQQRLAEGFLLEPPTLRDAGPLLRLLEGHSSWELDIAVVTLVDRSLRDVADVPLVDSLLEAALERLSADLTELRAPGGWSSGSERHALLLALWQEARDRFGAGGD